MAEIQIVQAEYFCTDGFNSYNFSDGCNFGCGVNKKTHNPCDGYASRSGIAGDGRIIVCDDGCRYCGYREVYKGFQAKYYEISSHFDNWTGDEYATVITKGKIYNNCISVKLDGVYVFGGDSDAR